MGACLSSSSASSSSLAVLPSPAPTAAAAGAAATSPSAQPPALTMSTTTSSSATSAPPPPPAIELISKLKKGKSQVDRWKVLRPLGEGGYAQVELAQSTVDQTFVALKKMSKAILTKQREYGMGQIGRPRVTTALDKVRREIDIMKQLSHPHVIALRAVIDDPDEDKLYLVLEYASKGQVMDWDPAAQVYRTKVFPLAQPAAAAAATATTTCGIDETSLRKIFLNVVDALEYVHGHRVIHRDIKPDNLLVTDDMSVKLGDFGVARQFAPDESTLISETHGTYHFFAPEMCSGEHFDGFIADIWALGVTLFIMATGVVPYMSKDNNPQELFDLIAEQPIVFPEDTTISASLRDLLMGILNKDPQQRFTFAQIRAHDWLAAS